MGDLRKERVILLVEPYINNKITRMPHIYITY